MNQSSPLVLIFSSSSVCGGVQARTPAGKHNHIRLIIAAVGKKCFFVIVIIDDARDRGINYTMGSSSSHWREGLCIRGPLATIFRQVSVKLARMVGLQRLGFRHSATPWIVIAQWDKMILILCYSLCYKWSLGRSAWCFKRIQLLLQMKSEEPVRSSHLCCRVCDSS